MEVLSKVKADGVNIVTQYLNYKKHACRQEYDHPPNEDDLAAVEKDWPEYAETEDLIRRPVYLSARDGGTAGMSSTRWLREYLGTHVQSVQLRKQNHVHIYNEETKEREPLQACRRKDKPKQCKADFPRTAWLIERAVVLCQGLIHRMGMASSGRRSKLGSLHGPMNQESLNGTHPAMLAVHQFNSDVQLPYRFPVTQETHSLACDDRCFEHTDEGVIIQAAQAAQDAQAGYACDYSNKRQPMAFNEVKECCKGHTKLAEQLTGEHLNTIGKRHATRLMNDLYGKGIVRGQVENTNLRANAKASDVTWAETFKTCLTASFFGHAYFEMVERLSGKAVAAHPVLFAEIDARNNRKKRCIVRNVAELYGQRPRELRYLSPYEFVRYWEPRLLKYPRRIRDEGSEFHAVLTEAGEEKLREERSAELKPGTDYVVKQPDGGAGWLAYSDVPSTQHIRHTWVLVRRRRPVAPSFFGAPVPRHRPGEGERSAQIVMTYFRPWTCRAKDEEEHVPYAGHLRGECNTWQEALASWLDGGILCKESKRYIGNFLTVHRVRPSGDDSDDAPSDDQVSDEELEVSHARLNEALETRVGGRGPETREDDGGAGDPENAKEGSHRENSTSGMALAKDVWANNDDGAPSRAQEPNFVTIEALDDVLAEARKSQRRERSLTANLKEAEERTASVRAITSATPEDVLKWLAELKRRRQTNGRLVCNAKQYDTVEKVANRVISELRTEASGCAAEFGEPLRWLAHGGPGTGKSHVIKIIKKELFEGILHWDISVNFQIVALQAVMADLLGGDTIHHACGIPVFSKGETHDEDLQRHMDVAKRVLQWRWLIIDEVSMVSAKLLAEMDVKLRRVVRDIGTGKKDARGRDRPFGGLNVLCCGDFWQLEPPDGGFVAEIPTEYIQEARKFVPLPTIAHGQSLMWSGNSTGMQGVTELFECERCDDVWLRAVQGELRNGELSEESHEFMHGRPTFVPGSWAAGDVQCGSAACRKLALAGLKRVADLVAVTSQTTAGATQDGDDEFKQRVLKGECKKCRDERKTKCLVATGPDDERFMNRKFLSAPAIFANNDLKYETNKLRAKTFARHTKQAVTYVCAKDKPTPDALRERPDLPAQKMQWLKRHDRECGNLYGVVPLIRGMPVALTEHLDRSTDKQLLRGKVGYVHSWVLHAEETSVFEGGVRVLKKLPVVVFVKFYDSEGDDVAWTLKGLNEPGLYPIVPKKSKWFLDRHRKYPMLGISRSQIPLCPAFAMTAHASQGQTLKQGAIVDLRIGRGTSPIASYVAMTRVQRREDLLVYRPFERALFTRGPREGPELLLKVLRHEDVDWKQIEAKYTPQAYCVGCNSIQYKKNFAPQQWGKRSGRKYCKQCVAEKTNEGTPWECSQCGLWKHESSFKPGQLTHNSTNTRVCDSCVETRTCRQCGKRKENAEFTGREWDDADGGDDDVHEKRRLKWGKCKMCMSKGKWKCHGGCGETKPVGEFSEYRKSKQSLTHTARACCNTCLEKAAPKEPGGWACAECGVRKSKEHFGEYIKTDQSCAHISRAKWMIAFCSTRGSQNTAKVWPCIQCKSKKSKQDFSMWMSSNQ